MKKKKGQDWSAVKKELKQLNRQELVKLSGELYKLTPVNRDFLNARFLPGQDALDVYKDIIYSCMWPEKDGQWFDYRKAKKAISDYKKASGDEIGEIELMLHYVETGNGFTVEFGDVDEQFYDSVISMCTAAAKKIMHLPSSKREMYIERFQYLADSSEGIGWGYHDDLREIFYETFPDAE